MVEVVLYVRVDGWACLIRISFSVVFSVFHVLCWVHGCIHDSILDFLYLNGMLGYLWTYMLVGCVCCIVNGLVFGWSLGFLFCNGGRRGV